MIDRNELDTMAPLPDHHCAEYSAPEQDGSACIQYILASF